MDDASILAKLAVGQNTLFDEHGSSGSKDGGIPSISDMLEWSDEELLQYIDDNGIDFDNVMEALE